MINFKPLTAIEIDSLGLDAIYHIVDPKFPLVILIHGKAGNKDVMKTFVRCIPNSFNIVSIQAPRSEMKLGGYSWWFTEDGYDILAQAGESSKLIDSFIAKFNTHFGLTPDFILGIGFSQGAAVMSYLYQENPELFTSIAMLVGFTIKNPNHSKNISNLNSEILMINGEIDETISLNQARNSYNYLESLGFEVYMLTEKVGHKLGKAGLLELKSWVNSFI